MSVRTSDTLQKYKHYRQKEGLVIVKFGAVWCGPCNKIKPFIEDLASKNKHVCFVDVDVNTEVGEHDDVNNVKTIPHFKFYVDGKLKREIVGVDKEKIIQYVDRYGKDKNKTKKNILNNIKTSKSLDKGKETVKEEHVKLEHVKEENLESDTVKLENIETVDNDKLDLVVEIIKDKIVSLVKNMSESDTNKIKNEVIKYLLEYNS